MSVTQSFRMALKSLATSKMRALLTMLGIIIGVASVIVIISLGDGMSNMINSEFEKVGTNQLQVMLYGWGSNRNATVDDMYQLAEENSGIITAVSPTVSVQGTVKVGGESYTSTSIVGVSEEYQQVNKALETTGGRFLQYIDVARMQHVCVIGSYLDQEAFLGDSLGKTLSINGQAYTVVGVLSEQSGSTSYGSDNYVYIPYTNATRLNGNADISGYYFVAADETVNNQAKAAIESRLKQIYGDDDYYMVISMSDMVSMLGDIQGTVMTVLVAIAGISLLVGGIGIMNIMLVSVTERTREIGIRKSLGAKRKDVRRQFIIEAGTTSAVGGVIGIVLGILLANVAGSLVGIQAIPSMTAILTAFGVSVGVGVVFGYLPANKAAKLNPIDALRYD